jgi:endonuclease/exonuclease/phosphatase family metal-dependent hydrolase
MLRVMTWNIRTGVGNSPDVPGERTPHDLERIAEVIREQSPDLVALQEVDRRRGRSGGVDQAAVLAASLGMDYRYAPNLVDDDGEYGTATLTRLPIVSSAHDLYPALDGWEPRGLLEVTVDVPGVGSIVVLNTHLQIAFGEGEKEAAAQRRHSAEIIADRARRSSHPMVLMGDFNADPDAPELSPLECLRLAGTTDGTPDMTFPASPFAAPDRRIDAIHTSPAFAVRACKVVRDPTTALASDHYPIVADLEAGLLAGD